MTDKHDDVSDNSNKTADLKGEEQEVPVLGHPSYEELSAQLTAMEAKANDCWDKFLRTQAELENQNRRHERDIANTHKYAIEKFIRELLPVMDSLEQGFSSAGQDQALKAMREGIELTMKMLSNTFEKFGIKIIDPQGQLFDPTFQEAMAIQEQADVPPNTVLVVLQKGYYLHDRLLRPARVVVAKAKEAKQDA